MGNRLFETKDGYKINAIEDLVVSLGAKVRDGKRHQKVFYFPGIKMIPCALGPSTSFENQVAGVLAKFSDYSKKQIYQTLQAYA